MDGPNWTLLFSGFSKNDVYAAERRPIHPQISHNPPNTSVEGKKKNNVEREENISSRGMSSEARQSLEEGGRRIDHRRKKGWPRLKERQAKIQFPIDGFNKTFAY